jgi:hypothetical protein
VDGPLHLPNVGGRVHYVALVLQHRANCSQREPVVVHHRDALTGRVSMRRGLRLPGVSSPDDEGSFRPSSAVYLTGQCVAGTTHVTNARLPLAG